MSTDPWGIDGTYEDAAGTIQTVSEQDIARIRTAIGRPPDPARSLYDECVIVIQQGQSFPLPAAANYNWKTVQSYRSTIGSLPICRSAIISSSPKADSPLFASSSVPDAAICLPVYASGDGARKSMPHEATRAGEWAIWPIYGA